MAFANILLFRKTMPRWLLAALAGAVLGIFLGGGYRFFSGAHAVAPGGVQQAPEQAPESDPCTHGAVQYAEAYQHGDWDYVLAHTLWIQDRLTYEAAQGGGAEAEQSARLELMARVSDRSVAGNHLVEGGVADQYVFRPGAQVEVIRADEGREDLHRPAACRAWLRVTYPLPENALLDVLGLPVRELTVGVNVDASGYVLKASVYGNVEIDWDSVVYQRAERAMMR